MTTKVTDSREKVGIFQQDKTKVWTVLLKISHTHLYNIT